MFTLEIYNDKPEEEIRNIIRGGAPSKDTGQFFDIKEAGVERITQAGLGFRKWDIKSLTKLTGIGVGSKYIWEKDWNTSHCRSCGLADPGDWCDCGFNCYNYLPNNISGFKEFDSTFGGSIWGAIEFKGNVQIHETGYRAGKAKIIAFYIPKPSLSAWDYGIFYDFFQMKSIARRYDVPLFKNRHSFLQYCENKNLYKATDGHKKYKDRTIL